MNGSYRSAPLLRRSDRFVYPLIVYPTARLRKRAMHDAGSHAALSEPVRLHWVLHMEMFLRTLSGLRLSCL